MSWVPANNWYDGLNSAPIGAETVNSAWAHFDFVFQTTFVTTSYAPLLSYDVSFAPSALDDHHDMRTMVVPPERSRTY